MKFNSQLQNWGLMLLILGWFFYVLFPHGPAVTFDTVSFIQAGNHFWQGEGYVHTATDGLAFAAHRFPFYPLLLSLFDGSNAGLLFLQLALFGTSLYVFHLLVRQFHASAGWLLIFTFMMLSLNYYCLWTESLYGVLFLSLLLFLKKEEKRDQLLLVGGVVALLCLTRMVGLVCGGSLLIAYWMIGEKRRGLGMLLIAVVVIGAWTVLGSLHLGETARAVAWHPVNGSDVQFMLEAMGSFLIPTNGPPMFKLLVGCCLFIFPLIVFIKQRLKHYHYEVLDWFIAIHFVAYPVFLLLSKSLIDLSIPFEFRTLFPWYLTLAVWMLTQLRMLKAQQPKQLFVRRYAWMLLIPFSIMNIISTQVVRNEGLGYNSMAWKSFKFTKHLQDYGAELILTNDQAACNYWMAYPEQIALLPEKKNLYSQLENKLYQEDWDATINHLQEESGVIVWIQNGITQEVYATSEEVRNVIGGQVVYDDGICIVTKFSE